MCDGVDIDNLLITKAIHNKMQAKAHSLSPSLRDAAMKLMSEKTKTVVECDGGEREEVRKEKEMKEKEEEKEEEDDDKEKMEVVKEKEEENEKAKACRVEEKEVENTNRKRKRTADQVKETKEVSENGEEDGERGGGGEWTLSRRGRGSVFCCSTRCSCRTCTFSPSLSLLQE